MCYAALTMEELLPSAMASPTLRKKERKITTLRLKLSSSAARIWKLGWHHTGGLGKQVPQRSQEHSPGRGSGDKVPQSSKTIDK